MKLKQIVLLGKFYNIIIIIDFVDRSSQCGWFLYLYNFLNDWPYANEEIFCSLVPSTYNYDDYGNYILHYVVRC